MDTPAVVVNKATFSTMGLCLSEEKEKHYDGHPHKISQRRRSSNRELLDGRRHYDKTAMDTKPQSTAFTKPAPSSLQQQQQAPVVAATQTDHSVSTTAASGCIT